MQNERKRLYRSPDDKIIAGVAGGLGNYFDIDATFFRILFILLIFAGGSGIILYLVLMLIMPYEPGENEKINASDDDKNASGISGGSPDPSNPKENEAGTKIAKENTRKGKNLLGFGLILLGFALLLNATFPEVFSFNARFFWPVFMIILGLFLVFRRQ